MEFLSEVANDLLSSNDTNTTDTGHAEHFENDDFVVLIMFGFSLALGTFMLDTFAKLRIGLPYTIALFAAGCALMGGANAGDLGYLGQAVQRVSTIDSKLLLQIFLPILIFESSFNMDYHMAWKTLPQVQVLAWGGVAVSAFLTAFVVKYCFPYEWSWGISLMFGSMIAASDPVAVVALLREVGAPPRLASVLEGESLWNDGSAYVFFLMFFDNVIGVVGTPQETFTQFLRLSMGSPCIGIIFAIITIFFLERCLNDVLIEVPLTVCTAFVVFYVCEISHCSGILGCCALGFYMSKYKSSFSADSLHALHTVWEFLAHVANTLCFVFAGVILVGMMLASGEVHIVTADYFWTIFLYIVMHFIRGFALVMYHPLFKWMGYHHLHWKDYVVWLWGGLRGTVGLLLAAFVQREEGFESRQGSRIAFHMAAFVFLTLVINGSTMKAMLKYLGYVRPRCTEGRLLIRSVDRLKREREESIHTISSRKVFKGANWATIPEMLPELDAMLMSTVNHLQAMENAGKGAPQTASDVFKAARAAILQKKKPSNDVALDPVAKKEADVKMEAKMNERVIELSKQDAEGFLRIKTAGFPPWVRKYFVWIPDRMVFRRYKNDSVKGVEDPERSVSIEEIRGVRHRKRLENMDGFPFVIKLFTEKLEFMADTQEEADRWVDVIVGALAQGIRQRDQLREMRKRFMNVIKATCDEWKEHTHRCDHQVVMAISEAANDAIDKDDIKVFWYELQEIIRLLPWQERIDRLLKPIYHRGLIESPLVSHLTFALASLAMSLDAIKRAQSVQTSFAEDEVDEVCFEKMNEEITHVVERIQEAVTFFHANHSDICTAIQSRQAAREVLHMQYDSIQRLKNTGWIGGREADELFDEINRLRKFVGTTNFFNRRKAQLRAAAEAEDKLAADGTHRKHRSEGSVGEGESEGRSSFTPTDSKGTGLASLDHVDPHDHHDDGHNPFADPPSTAQPGGTSTKPAKPAKPSQQHDEEPNLFM